jgi:hypothetical protein
MSKRPYGDNSRTGFVEEPYTKPVKKDFKEIMISNAKSTVHAKLHPERSNKVALGSAMTAAKRFKDAHEDSGLSGAGKGAAAGASAALAIAALGGPAGLAAFGIATVAGAVYGALKTKS